MVAKSKVMAAQPKLMAAKAKQKMGPRPFMLRLTAEDKAEFIAAAREDGYAELSAWLRSLARLRARKALRVPVARDMRGRG
jgi:hypothetical protein